MAGSSFNLDCQKVAEELTLHFDDLDMRTFYVDEVEKPLFASTENNLMLCAKSVDNKRVEVSLLDELLISTLNFVARLRVDMPAEYGGVRWVYRKT